MLACVNSVSAAFWSQSKLSRVFLVLIETKKHVFFFTRTHHERSKGYLKIALLLVLSYCDSLRSRHRFSSLSQKYAFGRRFPKSLIFLQALYEIELRNVAELLLYSTSQRSILSRDCKSGSMLKQTNKQPGMDNSTLQLKMQLFVRVTTLRPLRVIPFWKFSALAENRSWYPCSM